MKISLAGTVLAMLTITACASAPVQNLVDHSATPSPAALSSPIPGKSTLTYAPQPNDENLLRRNIFIQKMSLIIRESMPPQIALDLSGDLPSPCNLFRAKISAPDLEHKIVVDVYTVIDPNTICIQVLKPFQETVELGTFPTGHYSVWVNGELAGEFDS